MRCCELNNSIPLLASAVADFRSGFSLAGSTPGTIGIAILVVAILAVTVAIVYVGARRSKRSALPLGSAEPSDIALASYDPLTGEENGYKEGQPMHGGGLA